MANDPVNKIDPSGEFEFSLAGLSVSINIQGNLRSTQGVAYRGILQRVSQQLTRLSIDSVKVIRNVRPPGYQTHHLIEQRLWQNNPALQRIFRFVDDIPGVNLPPAEHQMFTNAWRTAFPYINQAGNIARPTLEQIMQAATRIYANQPEFLKAIFMSLL